MILKFEIASEKLRKSDGGTTFCLRAKALTARGGDQDTKNGTRGPWWCPFLKKIAIGIGVLNFMWVSDFL